MFLLTQFAQVHLFAGKISCYYIYVLLMIMYSNRVYITVTAQVCLEKLRYAIRHTELMDADFIDRRATSGWENVR